jgi:hypothetical protein
MQSQSQLFMATRGTDTYKIPALHFQPVYYKPTTRLPSVTVSANFHRSERRLTNKLVIVAFLSSHSSRFD